MRSFVALVALAALLATTGAAQGSSASSLSLSVSSFKAMYGHHVTISGRISSRQAGRHVSIYANPYGSAKLHRIHVVMTGAGGRFSIKVAPSIATSYEARWSTATSRTLTVGVQPRVNAIEGGDGRIWVGVTPTNRFVHRSVELQQLSGGVWRTTTRKRLGAYSTANLGPFAKSATVRIAMSVNEAGAGFLGTTSHPINYRAYAVTLMPQSSEVIWGKTVELAGRVQNNQLGATVTIDAWPYGQSSPVELATVATSIKGEWQYRALPTIDTTYQAHLGSTDVSQRVTVGVAPMVTVSELGNGKISARVTASRSFAGRQVKLQQLTGRVWRTVAQARLDAQSTAIFDTPLATSRVRVAFSVNEAGKGYRGSTSHMLAYHSHGLAIALSTYRVLYGSTLTLRGRIANGQAGERVAITAWPHGASAPHKVATVMTIADGRWSAQVRPAIETSYAASAGLAASRRLTVGVEPMLTMRELGNGNVWAHVAVGRSLNGRMLQLQQRMPGGAWKTIQKRALDHSGTTVFAAAKLGAAAKIRTALSVNQAGAGLLGAFSHALTYQAT